MNWKIIILLSIAALIMGPLSVFGFTQGLEPFLWLIFAVAAGVILSRTVKTRLLAHALLIGIVWGILNGLIQAIFFETYLANNPTNAEEFRSVTFVNARFVPLIGGPIPGIIAGLVIFVVSKIAHRALNPRSELDASEIE